MGKIAKVFALFSEGFQDIWYFLRYNSYSPMVDLKRRLFYKILIDIHTVEKGLALRTPRRLFGGAKIANVLGMTHRYPQGAPALPLEKTMGALQAYRSFHADVKDDRTGVLDQVDGEIQRLSKLGVTPSGGVRGRSHAGAGQSAAQFLTSRTSCRNFRDGIVAPALVEQIVALAQSAPSQCNRQSVHVHAYQGDKALIGELLRLQGGASGFVDQVSNLFIVSSELTAWGGPNQRNQPYVDGGIFLMSLLSAAHAHGIATCPLNLAIDHARERTIRRVGNIPASERLISMVAFGTAEDRSLIANSPRRPVGEVLRLHTASS